VIADRHIALDLDERADPRVRADPAAVEVDELVNGGPFAEDDIRRNTLEPLGHIATIMWRCTACSP
jgi:hypothetical protein